MLVLATCATGWLLVGAPANEPEATEEPPSHELPVSSPDDGDAPPPPPPPPPPVEETPQADPQAMPRKAPSLPDADDVATATEDVPAQDDQHDRGAPRRAAEGNEPEARCPQPTRAPAEMQTSLYSRRVQDSPFRRKGFALALAPGVSGCGGNGDWCNGTHYFSFGVPNAAGETTGVFAKESRPGPSIIVEAGYRPVRLFEAVVFLQSTYRPQQINLPDMSTAGKVSAFDISAGLAGMLRPLGYSRFDPFVGVGVGVGHHRSRAVFTSSEQIERDYAETLTRALVRTSVGLDIFIVERFALGPRFDYDFFAGGRLCEHMQRKDPGAPAVTRDECQSARDLNALSEVEGGKGPARQLPQFWRLSLDLRTYF